MSNFKKNVFCLFFLIVNILKGYTQVIFVTPDGAGLKNGISWSNALDNSGFKAALKTASLGTTFWLSEGKYYAGLHQDSSYTLKGGVEIYGGFPIVGSQLFSDRNDSLYRTVFEGDIYQDDLPSLKGSGLTSNPTRLDNTKKIFINLRLDTNEIVIDGCSFQNATTSAIEADSIPLLLRNCKILNNGGRAINYQQGKLNLSRCVFENNARGIFTDEVNLSVSKTIFHGCLEAVYSLRSSLNIINSKFEDNGGGLISQGGGIYYYSCNVLVDSCMFKNNFANEGGDIYGSGFLSLRPKVQNSIFSSSRLTNGSIWVSDSSIIYNCSFINCEATGAPLVGFTTGAKYIDIIKCRFENNAANVLINSPTSMASALIDSCIFRQNSGILVYAKGNAPITNSIFEDNLIGPAILHKGFNTIVKGCTFRNNVSNNGAAISDGYQGSIQIKECLFENNKSPNYNKRNGVVLLSDYGGGAIYLVGENHLISNCVFISNSSNERGGAIYYKGNGLIKINSCVFNSNKSIAPGGAIFATGVTEIDNCVFSSNYSRSGATLSFMSGSTPPSISTIRNSTFNNNYGDRDTGMIFIYPNSVAGIARFYNNIFWNSKVDNRIKHFQLSDANITLKNNIIDPQISAITNGTIQSQDNYSFYPLFKDSSNVAGADSIYGTADDGLSLRSCSPAIALGRNDLVPLLLYGDDLSQNPRLYDSIVDIGAYEYQGSKTSNTIPYVSIIPLDSFSCIGSIMRFKASFANAGTKPLFIWQKNGIGYQNNNDSIFEINNASLNTNDTISCLMLSSDSCSLPSRIISNPIPIVVYEKPSSLLTISGDRNVKTGTVSVYSIPKTDGSSYNWSLIGGDIVSGNGTDSVFVQWSNISGTYKLSLVETNRHGCIGDSIFTFIILDESDSLHLDKDSVYSVPIGDSTMISVTSNKEWFVTTSADWITLEPNFGFRNSTFNIITAQNLLAQRSAFVQVRSGDSSVFVLVNQEGINSALAKLEILKPDVRIFPNPSNGIFYLNMDGVNPNTKIEIYNSIGGLIYFSNNFKSADFKVNLENASPGIYWLKAHNSDNQMSIIKLVIK
ncbi:MAG: right-handed parallel beta-helix repeat-containing protein [Bacteroidia bacterium]